MIKADTTEYPVNRMEVFGKFHDTLFNEYEQSLSGFNHLMLKMYSFWEYFSQALPNSKGVLKKVKKVKNLEKYEDAVKWILEEN